VAATSDSRDSVPERHGPCPDGTRIVTASLDSTGRLWDAATGQPIGESLGGHESYVLGAAFNPDGKRGDRVRCRTARVWDPDAQPFVRQAKSPYGFGATPLLS
jgi:WD40 repeat protein